MTREDIEKAARDYALDQLGIVGLPGRAEAMKAFMAGAEWRISSVWHKKHTVIPEVGRPALLELKDPDSHKIVYKIDIYSGSEWKGLTHYEYSGLIRFAYIDELIPERKEEAE